MELSEFALFPFVKLDSDFAEGQDGLDVKCNSFCKANISSNQKCRNYYEKIKADHVLGWTQCPFGFANYTFKIDKHIYSIFGIIRFPRAGGSLEKANAKKYPSSKVDGAAVERNVRQLILVNNFVNQSVESHTQRNLAALHEIRKYNRNLKQEAERICRKESPDDPDRANSSIVKIWKTSELMSCQFEILNLIANESLATLPLRTESEIFKVFDKCVRIFQLFHESKNSKIVIRGDSPSSMVCDKTFPILATTLIENAIKYSIPGYEVRVDIKITSPNRARISVSNVIGKGNVIPKNIFEKGVRGNSLEEGSGIGLYLAQLVARQHSSIIRYEVENFNPNFNLISFSFDIPIL